MSSYFDCVSVSVCLWLSSCSQVLSVLCVLSSTVELQWRDAGNILSKEEALLHLLGLAEKSAHRLENKHVHVK